MAPDASTRIEFKKYAYIAVLFFALLVIITVPFKRYILPDIGKQLRVFSEPLLRFTGSHILHVNHSYDYHISSDTTGMYLHFFNLMVIAIVITSLLYILRVKKKSIALLSHWALVVISYYLSLQLLIYGVSKIFGWQFYLPEPNTLFTTIGNTTPDLLFWSTMGVAPIYSVFSGVIEIIPALLLLFRRTRMIGGFIAALVLVNVLMINIGFDISVKLYSAFLLLLGLIISGPVWKLLYDAAFARSYQQQPDRPKRNGKFFFYVMIKIFIVGLMITEVIYPYAKSNNFNDALATRPFLHGAYEVTCFVNNKDTLAPLTTDSARWQRIFIHRKGFLIVQYMNDSMQDYGMEVDTTHKRIYLQNMRSNNLSDYGYRISGDSLALNGSENDGPSRVVSLRKINLNELPALRRAFKWMADGE